MADVTDEFIKRAARAAAITIRESQKNNEKLTVEEEAIVTELLNNDIGPYLKEIAIAERINNSDEVEIEEYFENSKSREGSAKINLANITGDTRIKGEGNRVVKRVYKFKGLNKDMTRMYEKDDLK